MWKHSNHAQPKLHRTLTLFDAATYGVGVVIGAGIYALIGKGAGLAGPNIWVSFIVAAIIAAFTALSYAELSSMFPKTGAEFAFVKHAFNSNFLAFFTGFSGILANIVSVAVVAIAFAGYLAGLFGTPILAIAAMLVLAMSLLNFAGIKESAKFTLVSTLLEVGGIVLIIILGIFIHGSVAEQQTVANVDFWSPVFSAAALVFFAFVGFEQVANISEETIGSHKNIPKAVLISLAVSAILYILVSISAITIIPWQQLAAASNPLALVAGTALGPIGELALSIIALFATSNTVLVLMIVASRMIYGISKQSALPDMFQKIHGKTQTPYLAVIAVSAISIAFIFLGDIEKIAYLSNYFIFVMFLLVNLSAIKFRITHPHTARPFRIPLNVSNIPITSVLGVLSSIFMLSYINEPLTLFGVTMPLLLFGALISLLSVPIYFAFRHTIPSHERV